MKIGAAPAAGLLSLAGNMGSCSPKATPSTSETLAIDMTVSLSGSNSDIGPVLRDGTRVAEQAVNAVGGVLGKRLSIHIVDDQSLTGAAVLPLFNQFLARKPIIVLGPSSSGEVLAVAPTVGQAHVLQLVSWATSPNLASVQPSTDRWLFRTCPSDKWQILAFYTAMIRPPPALAGDAGTPVAPASEGGDDAAQDSGGGPANGRHCRRPAIVYGADAIGIPYHERLAALFKANQTPFVQESMVDTNQTSNFGPIVDEIEANMPDCIGLPLYPSTATAFLKELALRRAGAPLNFDANLFGVGNDGLYGATLATAPGADNFLIGTVPDTNPRVGGVLTQGALEFQNMYDEYAGLPSGTPPPQYAATAFDSIVLAALAIEKAGTLTDTARIRSSLPAVSRGLTQSAVIVTPASLAEAFEFLRSGADINYQGASGDVDMEGDPANGWTGDILGGNYEVWAVAGGQDAPQAEIASAELIALNSRAP
jgi:ABC-type branched-subunit amino acid transport system substrate-binding protein